MTLDRGGRENPKRRFTPHSKALRASAFPGPLAWVGTFTDNRARFISIGRLVHCSLPLRTVRREDKMQNRSTGRLAAFVAILMVVWSGAPLTVTVVQGRIEDDASQRSIAMCADDFDEDGVPDVVVGYASASGGGLMLLRGNVDAIYPNTVEARARRAAGASLDEPFLPSIQVAETASAPDHLVAGDFDNDGHRDVAYATRGAEAVCFALGNGRGALTTRRPIPLPGPIRSLEAGELGRADGLLELFVEVGDPSSAQSPSGSSSLVLESERGAARALPRAIQPTDSVRKSAANAANAAGSPDGTVLRMRLNEDAVDDLVILRPDALTPTLKLSSPRATFTVSNTNDSGTGSLRAAIDSANSSPGADAIVFNISGTAPHTITLASPLPAISADGGAVMIDATSEPDFQNAPVVVLDGSNLAPGESGLVLIAADCLVRGLVINGLESDSNVGGGQAISIIGGGNCRIEGNYLGTNASGSAAVPNTTGVSIQISAGSVVGGTVAAARNVISGNESVGVTVNYDQTATANVISGNYIGTNAAGTAAIPNGTGIYLSSAPGNVVGGLAAGSRNVISGSLNPGFGVGIAYETANGNMVQGNSIGVAADGVTELGNGSTGMFVSAGASDNVIGGPAANAGNTIAYNLDGVQILQEASLPGISRGNLVSHNSIHSNQRLGINLSFDYDGDPAPNDNGDADSGPNDFQNYPVTTSASNGRVRGTLDSRANAAYTIDFYSNDECDQPSGFGEGKTWLGSTMITTNGAGHAEIDAALTVPAGSGVAATATDADNNTSEFSQCFAVGGSAVADLAVSAGTDVGAVAAGRTFNYYVTVRNYGPGTAGGVTMTDPLPSQTTFVDVAAVAGWSITAPAVGSGGSVVATTGAIPAGAEATFVITVRVRDNTASGDLVNTATVTSAMDPSAGNNTTTAITTLNGADATADLSVTIDADPDPVQPLGQLVYSIVVSNSGPSDATDARLTAEAPVGTIFLFALPSPTTAPDFGQSGTVTWDLQSFPDGRSEPFFVVVALQGGVTPPPNITATASVTNSTRDQDAGDNEATATTAIGGDPATADLSVTATGNASTVEAGDSVTYTVRVTNGGPNPATNVTLVDSLPSGAYFVSATTSQGSLVTPPAFDSGGAVARLGTLASGATASVSFSMTVTSGGGSISNHAFVLASTADPNAENGSATVVTTVRSAGMAMITWEPPDLESPELEPPPRNLEALLVPQASALIAPSVRIAPPRWVSARRRADPPLYYNIYTSNVPGVAASQATFFTSVPGSQTSTTAPVAPGGSFFVVTAGYPTGESPPTNEDGAGEVAGPTVTSVVATSRKITVKGSGFAAPMQVFVDGIPFVTAAKVKATKVNQKGLLLTGQSLADHARVGQTIVVTIRASDGGTTTIPVARK